MTSMNHQVASRFGASLTMKMDMPKVLAGMAPAAIAAPAFASMDLATSMPLSLEVTFAAYLAVLLGTFIPVTFLIVLYTQSEARKAGARSGN
jgi:photosystem II reaction center protein PsbM